MRGFKAIMLENNNSLNVEHFHVINNLSAKHDIMVRKGKR